MFLAVVLAFTGFVGFEAAAALGEEATDPLRLIPRAILIAIGVGVVYYVFLAWVMAVGFGVNHIDRWATNPAALDALASARRPLQPARYAHATWFSQATVSLLWTEQYQQVRPLLDGSIARARATGDSGRFTIGLAHRGCLALRRGELVEAEADTRAALAAAELPAPTFYRVLNGGVLIDTLVQQGELEAAEQVIAPMDAQTESGSLTAAVLRLARGRLRVAQGRNADGLADSLAVGALATRALVSCPSFLPWRSEAAIAQLALGEREQARRLAEEELQLARTFTTPRALGVALRAAGLATGGNAGEALLREAVGTLQQSDAKLEQARALADLGALLRRGNRRHESRTCATRSTSPTEPERGRWRPEPKPNSARPGPSHAASCSSVLSL